MPRGAYDWDATTHRSYVPSRDRADGDGAWDPEDALFVPVRDSAGRLIGVLLSGALYQLGGMTACLFGSAAMLAVCWATTFLLPAGETPRGQAA